MPTNDPLRTQPLILVDDSLRDIRKEISDLRMESKKLYCKIKNLSESSAMTNRILFGMIALLVVGVLLMLK